MTSFTGQWGLEKPDGTTQNKTAVYNADLDRIDQGRRVKAVAGEPLGAYLLTRVASGGLVWLATGADRPLLGLVSSSGTSVSTVASGSDVYVQVDGHIVNSTWAWTPGLPIYAHPTAPGSLTQTRPGSLAWPVAWAISSHHLTLSPGGLHEVHSGTETFGGLVTVVASAGELIASSRMATRHWGTTTPTGGISGEIAVASGYLYVHDAGTWKRVSIA
jgi:hypothetical protein